MYLVDTNIISEARKGTRANSGVRRFWQSVPSKEVYLSAITIGELRRGVEKIRHRGDRVQALQLEQWLEQITSDYSQHLLDFDHECAQVWGKLMSPQPQHPLDKQIAAIALIHDLTVVTRNVDDFAATGVRLCNPFD